MWSTRKSRARTVGASFWVGDPGFVLHRRVGYFNLLCLDFLISKVEITMRYLVCLTVLVAIVIESLTIRDSIWHWCLRIETYRKANQRCKEKHSPPSAGWMSCLTHFLPGKSSWTDSSPSYT